MVDAFSYDEEGRIGTKYKQIPDVPDLQRFDYGYSIDGKLIEQTYTAGSNTVVTRYTYDDNGRLEYVLRGDTDPQPVLQYVYLADGKLDWKYTVRKEADNSITQTGHTSYMYDARQMPVAIQAMIDGTYQFWEGIAYEGPSSGTGSLPGLKPQYNGNISYANYTYNIGGTNQSIDLYYSYDQVNRLQAVRTDDGIRLGDDQAEPPITPAVIGTKYDADFVYDNAGRFKSKHEGVDGVDLHSYKYMGEDDPNAIKRSRLDYIADAQGEQIKNYLYDANGNMVLDYSKKMGVAYDWRNLPVEFRFYDDIPDDPLVTADNAAALDEVVGLNVARLSRVKMLYDAGGQRIRKQVFEN